MTTPGQRTEATRRIFKALEAAEVGDLAAAYHMGVAIQTVWRWQKGERTPSPIYFEKLCAFAAGKGIGADGKPVHDAGK